MDNIDSKDSAAQAAALLGLRAGGADNAPVGDPPTLEDFGALYEGALDTTRRAQVLSHIAADQEIYRAWLEVVAAQATLDEALQAEPNIPTERVPMTQAIVDWLSGLFRKPAMAGGFAAAALMGVLLIPGLQDSDSVGDLYADFGGQWQRSPATLQDRVIRNTGQAISVSPQQQAVYLGLKDGLDQLGDEFSGAWLRPVNIDQALESLPADSRDPLEAMGRLATLARYQCQLEGTEAFFTAAEQALDQLRTDLAGDSSRTATYLARVIDQPGEPAVRVCDFSTAAVAVLDRK